MHKYQSMYGHFSDGVSPSKPFIRALAHETGHGNMAAFTNKVAYEVYAIHCGKKDHRFDGSPTILHDMENDPRLQMNVRNQLCKLAHWGILTRIRLGVYKWCDPYVTMTMLGLINDVEVLQREALKHRAEIKRRVQELENLGWTTEQIYKKLDEERGATEQP